MAFTETTMGIVYAEPRIGLGLRLLAIGTGTLMFGIPYPFLLHGAWASVSTSTIIAAACVVMPPLVGAFFIRLGLSRRQQVLFDRHHNEIITGRLGLWGPQGKRISLDDVERIQMIRHKGMDDPDVFEIRVEVRGHPPLKLGAYDVAEEGLIWQHRLQAIVRASQ